MACTYRPLDSTGATEMTGMWTTKKLASIGTAVTLAGTAAFLAIAMAYPKPISSAALGADWQCTRTAGMWTSCSRISHTEAVVQSARKDAPCPRRGLNG
jgi:hypothetical protein